MGFVRGLILLMCAISSGAVATVASAQRYRFFEPSLRSVPLLERPNRPGHFIGNAIRARAAQPAPQVRYQPPATYRSYRQSTRIPVTPQQTGGYYVSPQTSSVYRPAPTSTQYPTMEQSSAPVHVHSSPTPRGGSRSAPGAPEPIYAVPVPNASVSNQLGVSVLTN